MPTQAQRVIHAVRTRNYDRLRELLQAQDLHAARSAAGRTPLHAAAEEGDVKAADILIAVGADVNARMETGQAPLHLAAGYGGPCDLMDPDLDRRDPCGRNRHRPWSREVAEVINQIVKERNLRIPSDLGLEDKMPEENRFDILFELLDCFAAPAELYREFVSRGVDVDRVDPGFAEVLRGRPRYLNLVRMLLDHGAEINALDESGESALHSAVELGTTEMVELLLSRGAAPNPRLSAEQPTDSLVGLALQHSKTKIADVLLRHGAALPDPLQLHSAASNAQKEVMLWLLDHGMDINQPNENGDTPLLAAARAGHHDNVAALLTRAADFRVHNHLGDGLMHAAASWPQCLQCALPLGLPLDAQNTNGSTPLHVAAQSGDWLSVQMLLHAGASPNKQDKAGNTPLHIIFFSDEFRPDVEFPVFNSLVAAGADRSIRKIRNNEGKTAADLAAQWHYPEEYLQLLNPDRSEQPTSFLWLGTQPYLAFLPRAMVPVDLDDQTWPSCEHYFHAQKVSAPEIREHIRQAPTINDALCRLRASKLKPSGDWTQRCDNIMRSALLAKFCQYDHLREALLATGSAVLISDSNCDSYWVERRGSKFNAIGKMLTDIRAQLRPNHDDVG